ncbi:Peptidase_M14 domain-containing protein [Meloidogyne graminicola]|uniref:Peptidase_M14 domain-containing protein n=1 Tax=Meloidogyne graminicola TaxID=189291 RepID=A0A8S9ZSN9_9BILA|nr:Peptidase_M14 domain-containing protein [Meloidogyne graminicola]
MIYFNKIIKKQQKYFIFLFFIILLFNLSIQDDWIFKPENNNNKQLNEQERKDFTGFKLLRLNPRTELQINWLRSLYSSDTNSAPPFFNLDFWQPPTHIGSLVDLTVSPIDAPAFFGELRHRELDYLVIADNLEDLINKERNNQKQQFFADNNDDKEYLIKENKDKYWFGRNKPKEPEYRYDRYNPLTRIEEHLFRLREMNPKLISLYEIGKTHENRSIVTAKISARRIMPDENWRPFKGPAIWIDAGIHAREWIGPATAMILIAALINGYNSEDIEIRYLVENIDWYITPVLNPDGIECGEKTEDLHTVNNNILIKFVVLVLI